MQQLFLLPLLIYLLATTASVDDAAAFTPPPQTEIDEAVGIYKSFLPAASSPGLEETLYLNVDNTVRWELDYLNGEPPILQLGLWERAGQTVTVTVTTQDDVLLDAPVVTNLTVTDEGLQQVFGDDMPEAIDVRYLRFEHIVTTLYPTIRQAQQSITPTLTVTDLQNATYTGIYSQPVRLTAGRYEGEPFVEDGAARPTVTFVDELVRFGDLNGNGQVDAAVIVAENSGGSGTFSYLAVMLNVAGEPFNAQTIFLGDRVQVRQFELTTAGQIILDMVVAGPDDPFCCPTQKVRQLYSLLGQAESAVQGTIAFTDAAGPTWQLTELGRNQPVLTDTSITLNVQADEGRVVGSGGCNNYSAGFTNETPRELSLDSVISTRRLCAPRAVSDQETAYFTRLRGVQQWQYLNGDLLLTYELEGGEIDTLRFTAPSGG